MHESWFQLVQVVVQLLVASVVSRGVGQTPTHRSWSARTLTQRLIGACNGREGATQVPDHNGGSLRKPWSRSWSSMGRSVASTSDVRNRRDASSPNQSGDGESFGLAASSMGDTRMRLCGVVGERSGSMVLA